MTEAQRQRLLKQCAEWIALCERPATPEELTRAEMILAEPPQAVQPSLFSAPRESA